jgi:N-methylhydantoinase B
MNFSGVNPRTGRFYVYNESIAGGLGARLRRDGVSGAQAHITNTSNLPVEALEPEHPLLVEAYELVPDSGGPGRTRGGMAVRRRIRVLDHDARVLVWGACTTTPPWGLAGGRAGGGARTERSPDVAPLDKGRGVVRAGESVALVTAGGGGIGDPRTRDRARVRRDLAEGRISVRAAREVYGLD